MFDTISATLGKMAIKRAVDKPLDDIVEFPSKHFIYTYPSQALKNRVTELKERNNTPKRKKCPVVVVKQAGSDLCAVFGSYRECNIALNFGVGNACVGIYIQLGFHAKLGLEVVGLFKDDDEIVFDTNFKLPKPARSAYVIHTNTITGEKTLYNSLKEIYRAYGVNLSIARKIMFGMPRHSSVGKDMMIEVATMDDILELFPDYVPVDYRSHIAPDKNVRAFLSNTFDEVWSVKNRLYADEPVVVAWKRFKEQYIAGTSKNART